jgi:acetyltransferase-like isoleucine patch superfamily enzyme
MSMTKRIIRELSRRLVKMLPEFGFPRVNNVLFRLMGYDIHPSARIASSVRLEGNIGITIGARVHIGASTVITGGMGNIKIEEDCDISGQVCIVSGTHVIDSVGCRSAGQGTGRPILIKRGAWVGYRSLILSGVTVGEKAIVGAGAIVTRDVEARTVVTGCPAKPRRKI